VGSALVLMPAAVLIFLVLGALAVDSAAVFLAQRQLANAAVAAANDAVAAVDVDAYYGEGSFRLEPAQVQQVAEETVARLGLDHLDGVVAVATVEGDVVEVTITARVEHIFSGAVPGGRATADVAATAVADAERR
jgi:Flp pilus assembly protein TadG